LLEEVFPPCYEVLKFVLPEEDGIRRFGNFAPEPHPLENQLHGDVDGAARFMAVFEERKVADHNLVSERGVS
jgi:hypothetical protein